MKWMGSRYLPCKRKLAFQLISNRLLNFFLLLFVHRERRRFLHLHLLLVLLLSVVVMNNAG